MNATSAEQFELSYRRFAEQLRLGEEVQCSRAVLKAVCSRLSKDSSGYWLMVLDGLDDEDSLIATDPANSGKSLLEFIPTSPYAKILITTRSKRIARGQVHGNSEYVVRVDSLGTEDAAQILFGKVTENAAKWKWIEDVSNALDGSAGALALTYDYLQRAGKNFSHRKHLKVLQPDPPAGKQGAARAWELHLGLLKAENPNTVDLMLLISRLDVQGLPNSLFARRQIQEISTLQTYGLVESSLDRRLFFMTAEFRRLAQEWLARHEEDRQLADESSLSMVRERFCAKTEDDAEQAALLPCALAALRLQLISPEGKRDMAALLSGVSKHYVHQMKHEKALEYLERCLALHEDAPDSEKKRVSVEETKRAIGEVKGQLLHPGPETALAKAAPTDVPVEGGLIWAGRRLKAPEGFPAVDSLVTRKQLEAPDMLPTKDSLGRSRRQIRAPEKFRMVSGLAGAARRLKTPEKLPTEGSLIEARRRFQDLKTRDAGWQSNDPARAASNLAALQMAQGRKPGDDSEPARLYQKVLDWHRESHGADPIVTPRHQWNLALAHESESRHDEAESLCRSAAQIVGAQIDTGNTDTDLRALHLKMLSSLAGMYSSQGRAEDAEQLYRDVVLAQSELLGPAHPETLLTRHGRALLLQGSGQADAAWLELRGVLMGQRDLLGVDDPATLQTACNMALNYRMRGELEAAEGLYRQVLETQRSVLGETHVQTVTTAQMLDELLGEAVG